jgi:hypothetical protein
MVNHNSTRTVMATILYTKLVPWQNYNSTQNRNGKLYSTRTVMANYNSTHEL